MIKLMSVKIFFVISVLYHKNTRKYLEQNNFQKSCGETSILLFFIFKKNYFIQNIVQVRDKKANVRLKPNIYTIMYHFPVNDQQRKTAQKKMTIKIHYYRNQIKL